MTEPVRASVRTDARGPDGTTPAGPGRVVVPRFGSGFLRVAITDRAGCPRPLADQVRRLAGRLDVVILRERDLDDGPYELLARDVLAACDEIGAALIIHGRPEAARAIRLGAVHLPLPQLGAHGRPSGMACVGTNVHELGEVDMAQRLGADYLVASPIFPPSCKPGARPRGIAFLARVLAVARVPVLALGGMDEVRESLARSAGAAGACRMSGYMRT